MLQVEDGVGNDSLVGRLLARAEVSPNGEALVYKKPSGEWAPLSWLALNEVVNRVARAFIAQGLSSGGGVVILSENRMEGHIAYLAAIMAGGQGAFLHSSMNPDTIADLVQRINAHIIVVEGKTQFRKLRNHMHLMRSLDTIIYLDEAGDNKKLLTWAQLLARGDSFPQTPLGLRIKDMDVESWGNVVFTPGTMGANKAIPLNQGQLLASASDLVKNLGLVPGDRIHCPDPLSSIQSQMFNIILPIVSGATAFVSRTPESLEEDLAYMQPSVFMAHPTVWSRFQYYLRSEGQIVAEVNPAYVEKAAGIAENVIEAAEGGAPLSFGQKLGAFRAKRRLFMPVKNALGFSQLRYALSAGARLRTSVLSFFRHLNFPIYECYSLAESGGIVALNLPGAYNPGTAGQLLPEFEAKIDESGELLLKGKAIFDGYLKDRAETRLALRDGWLYTGDRAEIDEEGFITIVERHRDTIHSEAGEKLSPTHLEENITELPELSHALVAASGQQHLVAIVTLHETKGMAWVKERKANVVTIRELAKYRVFVNYVQSHIDTLNSSASDDAQIKKFKILWIDFQAENGELTATGSLRRSVLHGRFGETIRALYGDEWLD